MEKQLIKNTQTRASLGFGHVPRGASGENQTGHPTPLLSAASQLSIHSTPVTTAAGALLLGTPFFFFLLTFHSAAVLGA